MKVNELRIGNYLLCGNKTDLLGDKLRLMMVEGEMAGIHKVFQIKLRQK